MILDKTIELLKTKYKSQVEGITVSDACIGIYLTAIRLSDGSCGVASTELGPQEGCCRDRKNYGEFTPAKINGKRLIDLLECNEPVKALDSLKVAALNAISMKIISASGYKIIENADPINLIDLQAGKTITLVGGFHSYIQKISETDSRLYVLELDENMLQGEMKRYYVPADEYARILPLSDIIIMTGLTLVNNTIDGLINSILPHSQVIVAGPSSSLLPDVLFENKVNIIGATRITDAYLAFEVASQAGGAHHLFRYCAEKICILNEKD